MLGVMPRSRHMPSKGSQGAARTLQARQSFAQLPGLHLQGVLVHPLPGPCLKLPVAV